MILIILEADVVSLPYAVKQHIFIYNTNTILELNVVCINLLTSRIHVIHVVGVVCMCVGHV